MIDVGGPAMIRAAAKNHARVAVVVDPADYETVLEEIRMTGGTKLSTRERLAARAFSRTASYDAAIAGYFASSVREAYSFPESLVFAFDRVGALRYGENPHQRAALYAFPSAPPDALVRFHMLQGKELSFNNLLDLDSAVTLARDFEGPAAVIVKHNNPCGAAVGETISEAFGRAFACDPLAAFGGIIAIRGKVDGALASLVLAALRRGRRGRRLHGGGALLLRQEAQHPAAPRLRRRAGRSRGSTGSASKAASSCRTRTPSPTRALPGRSSRSASRRPSSGRPASSPGKSPAA